MTQAAFVIAVDGPAASGKGTLARRLARHFDLLYLDTGALYRATARDLLARGGGLEEPDLAAAVAAEIDPASLGDPGLREERIGRAASAVATIPAVRAALLGYQRRIAATPPGAVMDGRDIGTVVWPEAQAKLFVIADAATRARRRWAELQARGEAAELAAVQADLEQRDRQDSGRAVAPLKPAEDAMKLDTSLLSIDGMVARAVALIEPLWRGH